ncbi:MAG TPA: HXXEE domain-containing protein [Bryobacteraceae bacterium]|jgi:hypothetical protein
MSDIAHNISFRRRLFAGGLSAMGIAFNAVWLGRATAGLSVGLVVAYLLWLFWRWQGCRERILWLYLLSLGLFCLHFSEEYLTRFYIDFPGLFGIQWSGRRFLVFNLVWLVVFALSAVGVYCERSEAYVIVIFFALFGGVLNGLSHITLSLLEWRYFPGTVTAPFMLASGIFLLHRLRTPKLGEA